MVVGIGERELLDRVGHVRDHLHGGAQIVAAPFLGDDLLVDAARGDVVALPRRNAGEALVVAQVEIGLGPVVGDVDLAVLVGAHRPRIDVEIGIELANADFVAARLQQSAEARRHETFAERGDHAAGNKNEPRHGSWALRREVDSGQALAHADFTMIGSDNALISSDVAQRVGGCAGAVSLGPMPVRPEPDRRERPSGRANRRSCALTSCLDGNRGQDDRQHHEQHRQPLGRAGQEIGRAARAHQPAGTAAPANPQAAAFGTLHQHHATSAAATSPGRR